MGRCVCLPGMGGFHWTRCIRMLKCGAHCFTDSCGSIFLVSMLEHRLEDRPQLIICPTFELLGPQSEGKWKTHLASRPQYFHVNTTGGSISCSLCTLYGSRRCLLPLRNVLWMRVGTSNDSKSCRFPSTWVPMYVPLQSIRSSNSSISIPASMAFPKSSSSITKSGDNDAFCSTPPCKADWHLIICHHDKNTVTERNQSTTVFWVEWCMHIFWTAEH